MMSMTYTATEQRFLDTEAAILAEYNAVCDKARDAADAAVDRIKAEGADAAMTAARVNVAIQQLVSALENADATRRAAIRRNNEWYDRTTGR